MEVTLIAEGVPLMRFLRDISNDFVALDECENAEKD